MNHEKAYELMMDALDGVITFEAKAQLDAHLLTCSDCYADWKAMQFVEDLFADCPVVEAPAGFTQRFQLRLAHSPQRKKLGTLFILSIGSLILLGTVAIPALLALLGIAAVYSDPANFAEWLVWLNQILGVSGSLFEVLWTTIRLFFSEIGSNPIVISWTLAAAMAVGLWAHLTRQPAPVPVENGNMKNKVF